MIKRQNFWHLRILLGSDHANLKPPVSSFYKAKRKRQDTMQMLNEEESKPPSPLASSMKTSQHGHERSELQQDPRDSGNMNHIDPSIALKNFLDRVPISSNSVIDHSSGVNVIDALRLLYENDLFCAPITDLADSWGGGESDLIAPVAKFMDRYIGFVDFPSMLLWCLEGFDQQDEFLSKKDAPTDSNITVFSMLQQSPRLAQAKVADMAISFDWQPFLPVHLEVDTLLHVLLLLSKHPVHVLPVIQQTGFKLTGFVTQNAVIHLLLQASALEWFDSIASKTLLVLHEASASQDYVDQSIAEVLDILWHDRANVVALVKQETQQLVGNVRRPDIHLLVHDDELFAKRSTITVGEFFHIRSRKGEQDIQAGQKAGSLNLRDNSLPGMDFPVTHQKTDTLKQVMEKMVDTGSELSFLVDHYGRVCGTLTSRDILLEFAPPGVDSRIYGGSFFDSALEQVGGLLWDGTLICDR